MIHDKAAAMRRERQDMPKVRRWLENLLGCTFRDTSLDEQLQGKDLISSDGEYYEVKIRGAKYRSLYMKDLLIETISNDQKDSPGWILYSEADWLIYLYEPLEGLIGYKISMPVLKKWWEYNEYRRAWKMKKVPNKGYNTINRIIPLKFLKDVHITYLPGEAGGYKVG